MKVFLIYPYYLSWHYTRGIKNLLEIWQDFLWFMMSFFSIGTLTRTLFSPFQRLQEHYKGGLDIENFFSVLAVNTIMRLVGFVTRIIIIALGIVMFLLTLITGVIFFIIWLVLPVLMIFILVIALKALFNFPS
ncbi:hypothetical protein H6775_02845 [Candidatus Nomurabacteria bacterium]|nr:hypothetical protein [Candidatus Nomurabacteria bacterium]